MRAAWIALRAAVLAAPFLLHLGTGTFADGFGGPPLPDWTLGGTLVASVAAVAIAVHDLRVLIAKGVRVSVPAAIAYVLVATPVALVALFFLISIMAPIAALPYALAAVAAAWRLVHRWNTGRDIKEP